MKREFLMLAQTAKSSYYPGKFFASYKIDGVRALWDGGISRGMQLSWVDGPATGLWTRNANPIYAPANFLDQLPPFPIDGELDAGIFNATSSTVRKLTPIADEWARVKYYAFDSPGLADIFYPGRIDQPNCKITITTEDFCKLRAAAGPQWRMSDRIDESHKRIRELIGVVEPLTQRLCTFDVANTLLEKALDLGHEGLMLRLQGSIWCAIRSHSLLKLKPFQDAEAKVVGFMTGTMTDTGGKYVGMIGSLCAEWEGKVIYISGLKDSLRQLIWHVPLVNGATYPFDPECAESAHFKMGDIVTFKFRERTPDGYPKEARYWRHRPAGL